jgi:hypothetical protein
MIDQINRFFGSYMFIQRKFYAYIVLQSVLLSSIATNEQRLSSHLEKSYPLLLNALNRVITICKQNDYLETLSHLQYDLADRLANIVTPRNVRPGTSIVEGKAIYDVHKQLVVSIREKKYDEDNATKTMIKLKTLFALIEKQEMAPICKSMIKLLSHIIENTQTPTSHYVITLINQLTSDYIKFEPFIISDTTSYFKQVETIIDHQRKELNSNNKK